MKKRNTCKGVSCHNSFLDNANISVFIDKSESNSPSIFCIAPSIMDSVRQFAGFEKKCHDDSCAARVMSTFAHAAPTDRGCEGRVSLACRTSFPVGPGKSIQRLRHDVQSSIHVGPGARSTVITILHVTLSAHPDEEGEVEEKRMRMRQSWQRHRMEENEEDVDANRIAIYPRARRL